MLNKRMKTFLLFTIICITIIGLSTISATEINDNTDNTKIVKDAATSNSDINTITTQKTSEIDTKNVSTKNKEITKKNNDNKKTEGEGTFADLNTDIAGSEVTLTKNYIQGELENNVTISEDKIIDGAGHTITAKKGIFNIENGVTFTLKNVIINSEYPTTYSNARDDITNRGNLILENVSFKYTGTGRTYGAPVYLYANSNLTVTDSVFDGYNTNRAIIYGYNGNININIENSVFTNFYTANAAIYMRATNSNLTVKNSNFTNAGNETGNTISYGGVFYLNNVNQNILIENCLFDNITSDYRGAVMYTSGNTTVKNSVMRNLKQSRPTYNGGAIWANSGNTQLYLENNTMENIVSDSANIYFNSGKINSTVKITAANVSVDQEDTTVVAFNVTDDMGNTIDFKTSVLSMELNGQEYQLTTANGSATATIEATMDPGVYPIKLNYNENIIMSDVTVPEITLTVNDIGLYKYVNVTNAIKATEEGSTTNINSNVVRGGSEESIVLEGKVNLDFNGNIINTKKGKLFDVTKDADVTIKNAIIINSGNPTPSTTNSEGRIANVTGGKIRFENVTFVNNTAPNFASSATGSAILALDEDSNVELVNCTVTNFVGTFINNVNSNVVINNSKFTDNKLGSSYNAFIANGGLLTVDNSLFDNNTANIAVIRGQSNKLPSSAYQLDQLFFNKPLVITNTNFTNNYASSGRGAAVNTNNDTNITNSVFIFNVIMQSYNMGGAILSEEGDLLIDGCIFINNSARVYTSYSGVTTYNNGTAIYNAEGGLTIKNSIIVSNITQATAVHNGASDATITANNNYWGTNDITGRYASSSSADPIVVDNWVVLNIETVPENVSFNDIVQIKAVLKSTDGENITNLTEALPYIDSVTFTAKGGDITVDEVQMDNGAANTTMTAKLNPFVVKATYLGNEVEYVGQTNMPEPQVYELNDGNWTQFFNEDGTFKNEVIPYSELQFIGQFKNRNMIINLPVNITTSQKEQAVFNDCSITVTAPGTNITSIQMNSENYAEFLIYLDDVENVVIKNTTLNLKNTEEAIAKTHTIEINAGSNITITNNTIITDGPEKNLIYTNDGDDADIITTAINAVNSKALVIDSNKIYTKSNGETELYGTLYSIFLCGRSEEVKTFENSRVTNNIIDTTGQQYVYGLYMGSHATNVLIEANEFNTHDSYYVNGIYTNLAQNSTINNNKFNLTNATLSYAIVSTGKNDFNAYRTIFAENNIISNNTITSDATYANAIQVLYSRYNQIVGNDISLDSDFGAGVVAALLTYTNISDNNITVTAKMESEGPSYDSYFKNTEGIVLAYDMMGASQNDNIYNNTIIITTDVNNIPAVNITAGARTNSITNNYLVSTYGYGDDAILDNGRSTTISDNLPEHSKTVTIIVEPENIVLSNNNTSNITINLIDAYEQNITKGTVNVYVDDEKVAELNVTEEDLVVDLGGYERGIHNVTINYVTYNSRLYDSTTLKTNLTVNYESKTNITTEEPKLGESTTLEAEFYTENGPVTGGKAIFKINDKALRNDNGEVIYVDVVDGKAVLPDVNITNEWMKPDTTIQAIYTGNDEFEPIFTNKTTVSVTKPEATVNITSPTGPVTAGETITLSASVTNGEDKVNTGRVVFKLNGKTLKDENGKALYVDVKDGVATASYTIPAKTKAKEYTLTAVFTDVSYERSDAESKISIVKD